MHQAIAQKQEIRTVRLYGPLGAKYGRIHRLAVNTTTEAIVALCALYPQFEIDLNKSHMNGVVYACFIGKHNLRPIELRLSAGNPANDIRIAPIIQGSKAAGLFQVVLGAVLIAASFIPGLNVALWSGGAMLSQMMFMMGAALALGGIIQMITSTSLAMQNDNVDNGESYGISGSPNNVAQGNPVPIVCGPNVICTPPVISAGVYAEDQT